MTSLHRRAFLARGAQLGLASLLTAALPRISRSDPLGVPVGIQLWTVHDALAADPSGTLASLRQIGYRFVESAGFGKASAGEFRRLVDDAGLVCPSAHMNFRGGNLDEIFDAAHALGAHFVVSAVLRPGTGATPVVGPWLTSFADSLRVMTLEDARRTAELANHIGMKARQAGLQYAYHNHFCEFVDQGGGAIAYDVLLRDTDADLVKFQIDCGWMMLAGYDPAQYLRKFPHRFPMLHVKDYEPLTERGDAATAPGLRLCTELGHGFIDYPAIFAAAKIAGLKYYFAEQEPPFHRSPLEAAKVDYAYLHSLNAGTVTAR
jgi:sugar phosphate isomerase/epimerase